MQRTSTQASGDRIAMGLARAVIDKVNDDPFLQSLGLKIRGAESSTDVEHAHPFGFTAFPMGKTTDAQAQAGMMKGAAEVFLQTLAGNMSHPVAMPAIDRRFRPNGMQAGEMVAHDAFKQFLHFGKDAAALESPKKVVLRVASDAPSSGGSGSTPGKRSPNSGANVAAEKTIAASLSADKDGNLVIDVTGVVTIKSGNASLKVENGKITATVGSLVVLHEADKIRLGGTAATKKVMLEDGSPAQKVYAL